MFEIFHDGVLIGRSELEGGDPPMGLAAGLFVPIDSFEVARGFMTPVINGSGNAVDGFQRLDGLAARTADGTKITCLQVTVFELVADGLPLLEVHCDYIEAQQYAELFSHHRKAHDDHMRQLTADTK